MKFEKNSINVIIVHGCPDESKPVTPAERTYDKHWMPWLVYKLAKNGIDAIIARMPQPWNETYSKWEEAFQKYVPFIRDNTILVGHSCGTAFLVHWLSEHKVRIKKLILVAPWKLSYKDTPENREFYNFTIDTSIVGQVEEIVAFTSNNEDLEGKESLNTYKKAFNNKIKVIELPEHGHYTINNMKTEEFLELLNEVIS